MATFTYPEVGATRGGTLPAGYHHLRYRTRLGQDVLRPAGEAVLAWRMLRGTGVTLETSASRAAPGVQVTSRLAWLSAPCQVVWIVDEADRVGFGYGTLEGHPARGEESFVVSRDGDGEVWFTITSFSRPARWYARAAGPVMPLLQRAYARRCGRALRKAL